MSTPGKHIIKTQDIEITFRDVKQDMGLPDQIAHVVKTKLNVKLNELFDDVPEGINLYIENLEIDLGEIKNNNWQEEFVDRALLEIKHALLEQAPAYRISDLSVSQVQQQQASINEEVKPLSKSQNNPDFLVLVAELKHFLSQGFFNWNFASLNIATFEQRFMELGVKAELKNLKPIYILLLESQNALRRFFNQFSETFFNLFIEKNAEVKWILPDGFNESKISKSAAIKLHLISVLLSVYYNRELIEVSQASKKVVLNNLLTQTQGITKSIIFGDDIQFPSAQFILQNIPVESRESAEEIILPKQNKEIKTPDDSSERKTENPKSGEYFVNNAGLVLLHPYLPVFFNALGLIDEHNVWISNKKMNDAVLITHYLVSGEEQCEEQLLLLNKLICGLPFEEPVAKERTWTNEEKNLCDELLVAIVNNWPALKSTSAEGLRNSFLRREGQLIINDESSILTVEQKPWDVLLGRLPWGIGIIKTPWMKNIMHVNWA